MLPVSRHFRRALALASASCVTLAPLPALACGGFFCMNQPMNQSGERIFFIQDADAVTAHVLINYQGDARKFSWVVPTPTLPTLGIGSNALFNALDGGTAPSFTLHIREEGDCHWPPQILRRGMEEDDRAGGPAKSEVQVISQQQIGPYDSAVIRSDDPDALRRWLRSNGYILPPKLDPLLDPYVAGKYYFVALKLQQDRGAGDLQPITLHYKATKPGIPIRLTGVAATPNMDIFVWVLGDVRAVPENYRHAVINEAKINWLTGGDNYKQVVTNAVNEAGGQAFVTDYAGNAKVVGLETFAGEQWDLDKLATDTDPIKFLQDVKDDGYFQRGSPEALAFVKRYVPIPKSLGDIWAPGFYNDPDQDAYRQALRREGFRVDAQKAVAELRQTVVEPAQAIQQAFGRHHYLTRLYTTMSPEEMTQDPTFRFNASLPGVDNARTAEAVRDCRQEHEGSAAPITVTLKDGTHFRIEPDPSQQPYGLPEEESELPSIAPSVRNASQLPFALRVEQLTTSGPASVIQDNHPAIAAALGLELPAVAAAATGMGCSQQPASGKSERQGAGEPATYALVMAAWWLALRRRPRKR